MHTDTPLITTIVAGLVLAFIFGAIANRFRLPPLVGYLVAGILVGPYSPGFVADQELAAELAEIGVILLMFGVGLHFSLKDLMSVRALAIPGAIAQIAVATLLGLGLALLMGWGIGAGLIFGLALSVASTVVLLKAMQDRRLIETEKGRIAVGWLIVEDLAMVLALVLIPAFASIWGNGETVIHDPFVSFVERVFRTDVGIWGVLGLTIVKMAAFVGFMLIVGRRIIPWALHATAHTGSRELFRLAVLAIALGVALGSSVLFGVSLALGAFFAGMILSESELSHRAAQETLPLRDAFAVLFFVSVGMLFDPTIVVTSPLALIATVLIIVVGKSLAAFAIVVLFRRPVGTALTISASLAQIGEFSFILASLGVALAIMPPEGQDLILAGALISIVLNPVTFWALDLVRPRIESKVARRKAARGEADYFDGPITATEPVLEPQVMDETMAEAASAAEPAPEAVTEDEDDVPQATSQSGHTILVGFGRVGSVVGEGLHAVGAPLVVIEDSDTSIKAARDMGIEVITGNAAATDILKLANIAGARTLLIAIPNSFEAGQVTEQGRKLNASLDIIARAHSNEEEDYLANHGADTVVMGEREIGLGMLARVRGEREATAAGAAAETPPPEREAGRETAPTDDETYDEAAPNSDDADDERPLSASNLPDEPIPMPPPDPDIAAQSAVEDGSGPPADEPVSDEEPSPTEPPAEVAITPDAVEEIPDEVVEETNEEPQDESSEEEPKAPPVTPEPRQ
jgi:CPA2 family monovalent cation:H+ antiporter-2